MRTEIEVFKTRAWINDNGAWDSTSRDVREVLNLETNSLRLSYEPFREKAVAEEIVRRFKGRLVSLKEESDYDPDLVY